MTSRQNDKRGTTTTLERRTLRYIEQRGLLAASDSIVIGVSGGADSTALLLLLDRLTSRLDLRLHAAYFDHRLRPRAATARERRFLEELTGSLNIPFSTGEGDVRIHARANRLSLEEAAREMRYRFLAQTALDAAAQAVAVGHTADDQAETVLMNILRGAGPTGLSGMAPSSPLPVALPGTEGVRLVRPLLAMRRAETEAYCRERGQTPLEDKSNRSLRFRRNLLRLRVLPTLREYNPRVDEALLRLADAAAEERRTLDEETERALADVGTTGEGVARLSLPKLRALAAGMRLQIMRLATTRLLGDGQDITSQHMRSMAEAVDKPTGTQIDLPRGLSLQVDYDELTLSLGPEEAEAMLPVTETPLAVPGITAVAGWRFECALVERPEGKPSTGDGLEAWLYAASVVGRLAVRRRRAGDRFRPLGMDGERKLQDIFVDLKVARRHRDSVPVVCDERGIVWVAGYRIAGRARLTGEGGPALRICAVREESRP